MAYCKLHKYIIKTEKVQGKCLRLGCHHMSQYIDKKKIEKKIKQTARFEKHYTRRLEEMYAG